jgi:hypothetical protein
MATTLEFLEALAKDAKTYRAGAQTSIMRNRHMNDATGTNIDQRDVDAILVDFINFVAMQRGIDFGMYTTDLGPFIEQTA